MLKKQELGHFIQKNSHLITLVSNEKLESLGITLSQKRVLYCLWQKDGLTQKELQEYLLIKPSSINGLLEQLLKKKLIKKIADPVDARANRIYLTAEGKALDEPCADIFAELEATICQNMTLSQKNELIHSLETIFQTVYQVYFTKPSK